MCSFTIWIFLLCYANANGILIDTKQGTLKGETLSSRDGRPYHAFYGIPYAEPPVGDLRFQSPILAKTWDGVRDATILPPPCISYEDSGQVVGQEDCLYLNVYTPKISNDTLLPVMVFVYGGRFMYGNALPSRYGPQYFMDKDVILITFHYRLGVLGFLSTEDEIIPGNYGLKDEVAVLQWVQKYIEAFGGDKNRVTIFGGSSGAASAALALISPLAEGLFHRVISQSGFMLNVQDSGIATRNAWKFASYVGCDDVTITDSKALLACLRKLPAEKLVENNSKLYQFGHLLPIIPWGPVVESEKVSGAFLVDQPRKLLGRKTDIPWILGINADDGAMFAIFTYFTPGLAVIDELEKDYKKYLPLILGYKNLVNCPEQLDNLTEAYVKYYFGDKSIRDNPLGFSKMITCAVYLPEIRDIVKLYKGPVYIYYYDHKNKESFAHMYGQFDEEMGIVHGDELISMYNWTEFITPVTEGIDLTVSKQIIELWTNFAAKGDPNKDNENLWKPAEAPNRINYLHINGGSLESKDDFFKKEYEFLDTVLINGDS